jgi:hypothetical protein
VTRTRALGVLAALVACAAVLVALELANGARSYGAATTKDACRAHSTFPGHGLDATVQRIVLNGLYGAACELGTSREELVLSLVPSAGTKRVRWDRATILRAVRAGLLRAVDDARDRDELSSVTAALVREAIERAPIDWLLGQVGDLGDLAGGLGDLLGRLPAVTG